jgi:protease-4
MVSINRLMAEKIGMTFDTVKTTRNSQGLNTYFDMSQAEKDFLNGNIQSTYALFKKRVADGRGMTVEAVEEVAQGRVWSGTDGKRVGLVDIVDDQVAVRRGYGNAERKTPPLCAKKGK